MYPPNLNDVWFDKVCLLTPGQIESIIHHIKFLRENKDYKQADTYRDKLKTLGNYWFMPDDVNLGNLLGHREKTLRVNCVDEVTVTGFVQFKNMFTWIEYST